MDFIVGLPKTRFHHDSILVLVYRLTQVAYCISGNTTNDAPIVENNFAHEIFRLHGFPDVMMLDRDSKFTSMFCKSFHKALGMKLNMSSTYHLDIDGKTK